MLRAGPTWDELAAHLGAPDGNSGAAAIARVGTAARGTRRTQSAKTSASEAQPGACVRLGLSGVIEMKPL